MRSLYNLLGLPEALTVTLVSLLIIFTLAPYLGGHDFGIFKIPDFNSNSEKMLKWLGPLLLVLSIVAFIPLWKKENNNENKVNFNVKVINTSSDTIKLNEYLYYYLSTNKAKPNEENLEGRVILKPDEKKENAFELVVPSGDSFNVSINIPLDKPHINLLERGVADISFKLLSSTKDNSFEINAPFVLETSRKNDAIIRLIDKSKSLENLANQPAFSFIDLLPAQKEIPSGAQVKVALVGTGITNIPQLIERLLPGKNFTENETSTQDIVDHGTRMASIIAAVAPSAKIIPLKTSSSIKGMIDAIQYAIENKVRILVLSSAFPFNNSIFINLMSKVKLQGILVIAPAGNNGEIIPYITGVLFVGATNIDDSSLATFSNRGPNVKLFAPGTKINVLDNHGNPTVMNGTILACSVVAGIAALSLSYRPELTPEEVEIVMRNSSKIIQAGNDSYHRVNALEAVHLAKGYLQTNQD